MISLVGWDAGLMGMCMGEKRKLTIPPDMGMTIIAPAVSMINHLGYGDSGAPPKIPGGATLVFEVVCVCCVVFR
jgi:FKBP-type peptidyl-prolyl cis-trans isomerase